MRKLVLILFAAMLEVFCISAKADFNLPASLTVIGDEAFMGTAADAVILQNAVDTIGDFAFSDMSELLRISIPESVLVIGDHAFKGSQQVVVYGKEGSYAEVWARKHGIAFANSAIWVGEEDDTSRAFINFALCGWFWCALLVIPQFQRKKYTIANLKICKLRRLSELYPVLYDFP